MNKLLTKFPALVLTLIVGFLAAPSAFGAVVIEIKKNDAPNVGFNDPTPVAPIGGNSGTTLGEQRFIAFQTAANIWGATLNSVPKITIQASWVELDCTSTDAVLGAAGATGFLQADFNGAPLPGTWYGPALANALAGKDLDTLRPEINARFNIKIGTPGCLDNSGWYLGLDGNHGNNIDLVAVLLHEFGHGLGFQTYTDDETGAQFNDGQKTLPSVYDHFLKDNSTDKTWVQMTNAERAASTINTGQLVWTGAQTTSDSHSILGSPRLRINSPASIAGNYQVGTADFGPSLSAAGITGAVAPSSPADGCSSVSSNVSGKIALIDRGTCNFTVKVKNAQNAGALGVIIADNQAGSPPPGLGGSDASITIPAVRITQADGNTLKSQLTGGLNATLYVDNSTAAGADSAGHPKMYTPNPYDGGSSVSHWDTSAFPNQLMEPDISSDLSHTVTMPKDLTTSMLKDIGWSVNVTTTPTPTPTPTPAPTPTPTPVQTGPATLSLSTASYAVNEGDAAGALTFTVNRTGDASGAVSVDFATSDTSGVIPCQTNGNGVASDRCDYATAVGTLRFAAGDSTPKTVQIPVINDAYVEPAEVFTLTLKNAQGAALGTSVATATIVDNDTQLASANPINDQAFFIREQYIDFLGRVPDAGGFQFWMNRMSNCPQGDICDRVDTAKRFFESDEFTERGRYVYMLYDAVLGRSAKYSEFVPDVARLNGFQSVAEQRASKDAYLLDLVNKSEFRAIYGQYLSGNGLTATNPTGFVNELCNRAGITPAGKQSLINNLQAGVKDPAHTLEDFILTPEISGVGTKFYDRAIITMQYFGFLRRDPDAGGFAFWWGRVATAGSPQYHDYRLLVNDFLRADEYNFRYAFLSAP